MVDLTRIKGLGRKTRLTRAKLFLLRLVEAYWPPLILLLIFANLALFGVLEQMSERAAAICTLLALVGGALLIWHGRGRYRHPTHLEALRALDTGSDLRPITGLTDRPADPAPAGQKLWSAHLLRLAKAAARLPVPSFAREWRAVDPYYARFALPVVLLAGCIYAGSDGPRRLLAALSPDYGVLVGADTIRVEAWITPPDYSRRPPVFLRDGLTEISVPAGSELTVRAQASSAPKLVIRGSDKRRRVAFEATPDGAYEVKAKLEATDTYVSVNWWGERASWALKASPDMPPIPRFESDPVLGENDTAAFAWAVNDDYGVERLELAMQLVTPQPAAPEDERRVPVELPGPSVREAKNDAALDMTRHPWAGLPVKVRLVATDGAGQEGASDVRTFTLPQKLFLQPLARATQEIRVETLREPRDYGLGGENYEAQVTAGSSNRLEYAPEGVQRAARMLEAVTFSPHKFFRDYGVYTGLTTAHGTLKAATSLDEARRVDGLLWAVALKAEYGSSADALAALLAAKRALEQALREGATEEEIARLTQAFRQAAENYLQAKLAEAAANGLPESAVEDGLDNEQTAGGGGPSFGQNSFEDMLNALEDLTETGASDQARQLLSDITSLLENLEFQQGNGQGEDGFALPNQDGSGEEGEASEEERELSENLEDLADALREQRELNDDTLEADRNARDRAETQRGGEAASSAEADALAEALAERQEAIAQLLEELAERQEGQAGGADEAGDENAAGGSGLDEEALENVLRAQRRATDALRDGQLSRAERNQALATDQLRDIAAGLANELDALRGEEDAQSNETDPFGREIGGANNSEDVTVPEQSERQRALDILE
ncbi:MAG: DUF4175 family protein, partial [Pseudomonadota bacterium]